MDLRSRYSRQTQLPGFGTEAQEKLQQARVLVVGAGGLGVPVLQYLTGMGVGTLGFADGDVVSLNNLHRQVLYTEADVGKPKVEAAARQLAQLNSTVHLLPYHLHLAPDNALALLQDFDLVVDATDNFAARYLINDACIMLKKPFVYGALHQFEGQVSVFNYHGGPTYRCLFPTPPPPSQLPDCNTAGVLGVVPGIIGAYQALEAVKVLTGVGEPLSGYLLLHDFLRNTQHKVKLKAHPENQIIRQLQTSYTSTGCASVTSLSVQELEGWLREGKEFLLLDVREQHEFNQGRLPNARLTPLSDFEAQTQYVPTHLPIVTLCQRGARSQKAAHLLLEKNNQAEVYSLTGGMEAWQARTAQTKVETEQEFYSGKRI